MMTVEGNTAQVRDTVPASAAWTATGFDGGDTVVRFPYGLPGFPEASAFRLEALPGCDGRFLLLQALDQPDLRLVVMPARAVQSIVKERHVREVCDALGWPVATTMLLFVVTLSQGPAGRAAFVNLRAPIFVDTERALAIQAVLPDRRYPFRQPLERRLPA